MLAALGQHYHWPRAELEALTARDASFWIGCMTLLNARIRAEAAS